MLVLIVMKYLTSYQKLCQINERQSKASAIDQSIHKTLFSQFDIERGRGNVLKDCETGYMVNYCKTGNFSWLRAEFIERPITWLNTCDLCGKQSTPKKVHRRGDVWGWNRQGKKDFRFKDMDMLCMSCWNKVAAQVRREQEYIETKKLINQLNKVRIEQWRKLQTQAS